jgi:lipid A 3-O-deacylase
MKKNFLFIFLLLSLQHIYSQNETLHKKFFRLYVDNDALIPSNNATDWGYTSGIRIDLFHSSTNLRGWLQGFNTYDHNDRVNTSGWGIMQKIYAPQKTSLLIPDKDDYPYSGALMLVHSFHASYKERKLNILSECIAGLMGPPSFGEQTHRFFHRFIKDPPPMGWDYQLPTDLLLNFNIEAEKLITRFRWIHFFGTGQVRSGTMNDGLSAGICLRAGNSKKYFNGLSRQYFQGKEIHASMSMKISADLVLYNALLQGGLFNKRSPVHDKQSPLGTDRKMQHLTSTGEFFFLVSVGKFALSFQLKYVSPELKGYESHSFGNISLYKTL